MSAEPEDVAAVEMDTIERREWLYTQSDDAVVAEICQLENELAALRPLVEALAGYEITRHITTKKWLCIFCKTQGVLKDFEHKAYCPVTKAREQVDKWRHNL
jgi:hypothetical protein